MARVSRQVLVSLRVGVVALIGVLAISYVALTAASGLPFVPTTQLEAGFKDVGSLPVGSKVRENSRVVGKVSALRYEDGTAVATIDLDGADVPVYADARAAIWDQSALGLKFIELNRGSASAGPLGNRMIPAHRNVNSSDIDQLLSVFDAKTRAKLSGALRELGGGLAGRSKDLQDILEHAPAMLDDAGRISSTLASPQADLPALLRSADQLVAAFNGHERQTAALVREAGDTFQSVSVDGGEPLREVVRELPGTLSAARSGLGSLNQPLSDAEQAVTKLRPGVDSLAQATPDLRGVLREGIRPLEKVPGVAGQASPAVEKLTKTVADARPLAPRLSEGLSDAVHPLAVLAPYASEIRTFFDRLNGLVSTYTAPDTHGARLGLAIEGLSVLGGGVVKGPIPRNPYPAPGEADRDRAVSPLDPVTGGPK